MGCYQSVVPPPPYNNNDNNKKALAGHGQGSVVVAAVVVGPTPEMLAQQLQKRTQGIEKKIQEEAQENEKKQREKELKKQRNKPLLITILDMPAQTSTPVCLITFHEENNPIHQRQFTLPKGYLSITALFERIEWEFALWESVLETSTSTTGANGNLPLRFFTNNEFESFIRYCTIGTTKGVCFRLRHNLV